MKKRHDILTTDEYNQSQHLSQCLSLVRSDSKEKLEGRRGRLVAARGFICNTNMVISMFWTPSSHGELKTGGHFRESSRALLRTV